MTIKDMHYDFKKKLNKVDSQQNRNLLIPEIDWALNEAQELFIKMIAEPRMRSYLGFEKSQRNIDDIRQLVTNEVKLIFGFNYDVDNTNIFLLPDEGYMYFLNGYADIKKGNCKARARIYIRQHDDEFENSVFDKSSFEWRVVNAMFVFNGLKVYKGDYNIEDVYINYIRTPRYMHNAEDFQAGSYKLPNGMILTGSMDCELPEHTHREIIDIAVLMVSGEMQMPDYQIKMNKMNINLK